MVSQQNNAFFDEAVWQELVLKGRQKIYEEGEKILIRGEPSPGLICLKKGKVKISSEVYNGNEKIFGMLVAPTLFGETEAFDQGPCMITATALSKTEVAVINFSSMKELISEKPEFAYLIIQSIGIKLRWTTLQAEDMTRHRIGYRLASLLLGNGKYAVFTYQNEYSVLSITHEEIANFIGSTRPKVTTLLREFAEKGFIENKRGEIKIRDRKALQKYLDAERKI